MSWRMRAARRAAVAVALVLAAVVLVGWWRTIPPGDNPFVEFALEHPVGGLTERKLSTLIDDPAACRLALAESTLRYRPVADKETASFCRFENAVRLERSHVAYSTPAPVSCPLAAALYVWERDILQPTAREFLGTEVKRVEHVGTFACRRIYGGRTGEPSQHATANAIDVIGYTLEDGRVVSVLKHWRAESEKGAFLRALQVRSCGVFRGVLGPDYNAAHHDHVHLDMGPYNLCR